MGQSIVKRVYQDKHTYYMACAQYVDWDLQGFGDQLDNAFIVQEVLLKQDIDRKKTETHYFEAWHVANGKCEKESNDECNDIFSIGILLNDSDAIKKSIGHRGKVAFIPRVFLVKLGCPLFDEILLWPRNIISEANGLRACNYTEELAQKIYKCQEYFRDPFFHEWEFDDPKRIFDIVFNYCTTMYQRDNRIDRINFEITINDFFPEGVYPEIRQKVIDAWSKML